MHAPSGATAPNEPKFQQVFPSLNFMLNYFSDGTRNFDLRIKLEGKIVQIECALNL